MEHKPLCKINQICAVNHNGAPCRGPYGKCDCGAEGGSPLSKRECCGKCCKELIGDRIPHTAEECKSLNAPCRCHTKSVEGERLKKLLEENAWTFTTSRVFTDYIDLERLQFFITDLLAKERERLAEVDKIIDDALAAMSALRNALAAASFTNSKKGDEDLLASSHQ